MSELIDIKFLKRLRKNKILLHWLLETRLVSWKMAIEEGPHVHAGLDWYPVYFEMDWVRYCEGEFQNTFS